MWGKKKILVSCAIWQYSKTVMWTAFIHHILVPRLNPLMWYPVQDTSYLPKQPSNHVYFVHFCQCFNDLPNILNCFFYPSGDKLDLTWSKIKVYLAPSPFSIFHCGSMSKQSVSKNFQNVFLLGFQLYCIMVLQRWAKKPQRQFDLFKVLVQNSIEQSEERQNISTV